MWEWSDGNTREDPVYDDGKWVSYDSYVILNEDASVSADVLYIKDYDSIITGQKVTAYVINSGNGLINMPPATLGRARDFLIRLQIDNSTAPGIAFSGGRFESETGAFPEMNTGVQILSFTETKPDVFMVCRKEMTEIA